MPDRLRISRHIQLQRGGLVQNGIYHIYPSDVSALELGCGRSLRRIDQCSNLDVLAMSSGSPFVNITPMWIAREPIIRTKGAEREW